MDQQKSIFYILGAGRSGTTVVDIILGNDNELFSAGELNRFGKRGGIPPGRKENSNAYKFWAQFRDSVSNWKMSEIKDLSEKFEYHAGIVWLFLPTRKLARYQAFLRESTTKILGSVNESIVIDSSKYPLRAYHLARSTDKLKYCIYVKKHPISVLRSFKKRGLEQPAKGWLSVNIYLVVVHILAQYMLRQIRKNGVRVMEVKYETVVNNTYEFLEEVENSFEFKLESLKKKILENRELETNMLFDGNRVRLSENLKIRKYKAPEKWTIQERLVYVCNSFWWSKKNKK